MGLYSLYFWSLYFTLFEQSIFKGFSKLEWSYFDSCLTKLMFFRRVWCCLHYLCDFNSEESLNKYNFCNELLLLLYETEFKRKGWVNLYRFVPLLKEYKWVKIDLKVCFKLNYQYDQSIIQWNLVNFESQYSPKKYFVHISKQNWLMEHFQ